MNKLHRIYVHKVSSYSGTWFYVGCTENFIRRCYRLNTPVYSGRAINEKLFEIKDPVTGRINDECIDRHKIIELYCTDALSKTLEDICIRIFFDLFGEYCKNTIIPKFRAVPTVESKYFQARIKNGEDINSLFIEVVERCRGCIKSYICK